MWEMNCFGGNPPNSLVAVSNQTHQNNGDIPVVFPTITSDFINISLPAELEEATIELFSISGQKLTSKVIRAGSTQWSLSELPPGMYFLVAKYSTGNHTFKINLVK